jgi:hypothetical protein
MTDLAEQPEARRASPVRAAAVTVVPTPACIQPRRVPAAALAGGDAPVAPRRAAVRQLLDAALAGVRLGGRDQQFLSRLVHWDKRSAAAVASLLGRAREAGRAEAGLTGRQVEVIVAALGDAAVYRASGAAAGSCWDCEIMPGGRCAEHARDFDRASAYAELASLLSGGGGPAAGLPRPARDLPRGIGGYRRRAPVAS